LLLKGDLSLEEFLKLDAEADAKSQAIGSSENDARRTAATEDDRVEAAWERVIAV